MGTGTIAQRSCGSTAASTRVTRSHVCLILEDVARGCNSPVLQPQIVTLLLGVMLVMVQVLLTQQLHKNNIGPTYVSFAS